MGGGVFGGRQATYGKHFFKLDILATADNSLNILNYLFRLNNLWLPPPTTMLAGKWWMKWLITLKLSASESFFINMGFFYNFCFSVSKELLLYKSYFEDRFCGLFILFIYNLKNTIDRNTNLYFSSFIHGIHLFHEFNSSSVPIKMLNTRQQG